MSVFVTGATGYAGTAVVQELQRCGRQVTALVRDAGRARALAETGAVTVVGDVRAVAGLMPAGTREVVHLAASLFPQSDRTVNVDGSLAVLAEARRVGVRRFIYTSSALVYGPGPVDRPVSETHPCRPNTTFARQQLAVERALLAAADSDAFPAVILRPSQIFGGSGGSFAALVRRIQSGSMITGTNPEQTVSLTGLADLVDVIIRCLDAELEPGEIFNVTSGQLAIHDLFARIAAAHGVPAPRKLPAPLLLGAGVLAGLVSRVTGRPPEFNLDVAKVAVFTGGPRVPDKAIHLLGYQPQQRDPMRTIVSDYLRGPALAVAEK